MNNIVWITGVTSGIGKAIALYFAKNKTAVAASARRKNELEKIKSSLQDENEYFKTFPMDVTNIESLKSSFDLISAKYKIDCLINNAGITTFTFAEDDSLSDIRKIIDTNLLGAVYAMKTVLPHMINNKKGTIINILSAAVEKVFIKSSAYAASKAGLLAYSKVLREEVREHNIRIINVLPGATKTPIWPNETLEKFSDRMMFPDEVAKFIFNLYSINSNLVPEEVIIKSIKGDL